MTTMRIVLILVSLSLVGCTKVLVLDSSGAPVSGAEVFVNGQLRGTTNASGVYSIQPKLSGGEKLFARVRVFEQPSFRPDHGPGAGWVMHAYQTSRVVSSSGTVSDLTVSNPSATQTLTVSPGNALIGWHLVASLDWDASDAELANLLTRFNDASQFLYNVSDGQFVIEQVEIADDAQTWGSAEIAFQVDSWVWPHTNALGGFLGRNGAIDTHVFMAPFSSQGSSPRTLGHELGHLAMAVQDEYVPFNAYCTENNHSGPAGGPFSANGNRAACVMDSEFQSSKYCSAHKDSAHHSGTWQPGPCWDTIAANYGDPGPGGSFGVGVIFKNRWVVTTPDARGAVVGTLDPLPSGLLPKVTLTNRKYHDLCQPINFVDPAGTAAAGGTVWIRPSFWKGADFTVGRLDNSGMMTIHGAHLGDQIWSPVSVVAVNSTNCTVTQ
jgi:hypothetical protein